MLNGCRKMYSLRACLNTQAQARYESENVLVVSCLSVATLDEILVIQIAPATLDICKIDACCHHVSPAQTSLIVCGVNCSS